MGQILHKCATTTHRIRAEIQKSKETISILAKKYNVNPKTIIRWKHRKDVNDAKMGPHKTPAALTLLEQSVVVEFRVKTGLPLDDVLNALKDQIPRLTRSNLHRILQKYGVSRLPQEKKNRPRSKNSKSILLDIFM